LSNNKSSRTKTPVKSATETKKIVKSDKLGEYKRTDKHEEVIDISKVKYYSFKHFLESMLSRPVPYIQGDKNDVVMTLQNRAVKIENVSYIDNIDSALKILISQKNLPNYTIALLYSYGDKKYHINIDQIDTDDDYHKLKNLANDSDVWIFLTNIHDECDQLNMLNKSRIHTEIRVRSNSWNRFDRETKRCIMLVDKFLDTYLRDITTSKYCQPKVMPKQYCIGDYINGEIKTKNEFNVEVINEGIKYESEKNGETILFPHGTDEERQKEIINYFKENIPDEDEETDDEYSEDEDKEIVVYCNNKNGSKVFEIDSSKVDPRTYNDVQMITSPLLYLDVILGPIFAIFDLGFAIAELGYKLWPIISRMLAEGEGGIGDFFRKIFRKTLFKIKSEWVEVYNNLPEEEAKKIILKDILRESQKLKGDPEKARKRLRKLSVEQLKFFGKDVLLELLSFNDILSDNQRRLIYLSGIIKQDEVRRYLKENQNDPKFIELQEHVSKKFQDSENELVNSMINHSHLYKHNIYINNEYETQQIGEAITVGTAIVVGAALGLIATVSAAGITATGAVSVPVVNSLLRSLRKGEGGIGDTLRSKFRGFKRFIRKGFLKTIKGKSDEEIEEIFNQEIQKKIAEESPEEIIAELQSLPISQLAGLGEETLKVLITSELLTIEQITLLKLNGMVTENILKGTVYSEDYIEDLRGSDINKLMTLSDARIRLLLRGKGFTENQVVEMLVAEKIFLKQLRGTPYDYNDIKKRYKKAKKEK
jgi:hypothetical protein